MDFPFNISTPIPVLPSEGRRVPARGVVDRETFDPATLDRPTLDRPAFDRMVLEHLPAAQRFAIRLVGDAHAGEDLMQDAVVRAANGFKTFRGEARFRTWLFQIVVNCFRDQLAARLRIARPLPEDVTDANAANPATEAQSNELSAIVAAEVSKLPPRQREVLVLIAYEQLSAAETAHTLGMTEQNVRTTLHLARQRLRERLAPHLDSKRT